MLFYNHALSKMNKSGELQIPVQLQDLVWIRDVVGWLPWLQHRRNTGSFGYVGKEEEEWTLPSVGHCTEP